MNKSIKEIKELLLVEPTKELLDELASDPRVGVQRLLTSYYKRLEKQAKAKEKFEARFDLERKYWTKHPLIAGVDEVGRGPLAGPVVSAAVILPQDFNLLAVNDSKQLTGTKRQELFLQIVENAIAIGVGVQSEAVIDKINIYQATRLAMRDAVNNLDYEPDFLFVDAMQVPVDIAQLKLIKGDAKSNSIAAASIVAKVLRDRLMQSYDLAFPGYDFAHNAGYGTASHLAGLAKIGASPIHRKTFQPVPKFLN